MQYIEKYVLEILLTIGVLWKTGPVLKDSALSICIVQVEQRACVHEK